MHWPKIKWPDAKARHVGRNPSRTVSISLIPIKIFSKTIQEEWCKQVLWETITWSFTQQFCSHTYMTAHKCITSAKCSNLTEKKSKHHIQKYYMSVCVARLFKLYVFWCAPIWKLCVANLPTAFPRMFKSDMGLASSLNIWQVFSQLLGFTQLGFICVCSFVFWKWDITATTRQKQTQWNHACLRGGGCPCD